MDSLTHLAAGVITPLAFRKAPRTAALVVFGVLAGEIPDIDILAGQGPHAMFSLHRSMTHSPIALAVFALFLALLLKLFLGQLRLKDMTVRVVNGEAVINKADDWPMSRMFVAALMALILHVYLDCMTTFGTQVLWPFSEFRVALPALFIVDLALTVPLLFIMIYCLIGFKKEKRRERQIKWARRGIAWVICWPLVCLGINTGLTHKFNRDYTEVGTTVEKITLAPVLGSPFYWKVVGENDREYRMAWVPLYKLHKAPAFAPVAYPKVNPEKWRLLQEKIPIFAEYARFSSFLTVFESERNEEYVECTYRDLRYQYSVPNFIIERSGYTDGLFNMQTRQDAKSGLIYAWRYLQNGSDPSPMWTALRPPVRLEAEAAAAPAAE